MRESWIWGLCEAALWTAGAIVAIGAVKTYKKLGGTRGHR